MTETDNAIVIGIGEYQVHQGDVRLSTLGLGSCVGIVIYDHSSKVYGLSHIMLPHIGEKQDRIGKYADVALPAMIEEIVKKGGKRLRLKAKIAGGASLFNLKEDTLQIGKRNIAAVEEILTQEHIPIIARDVGGDRGRTIIFHPDSCELYIRMVKKDPGEKNIIVI